MGAVHTETLLPTVLWCLGILIANTITTILVWTRLWVLLAGLGALEALFAAYYWLIKYPAVNAQPAQHTPEDDDTGKTVRETLNSVKQSIRNIFSFLEQWSLGARYEDMGRDDVLDMMCFSAWYSTR